jgi:hypothetical protein
VIESSRPSCRTRCGPGSRRRWRCHEAHDGIRAADKSEPDDEDTDGNDEREIEKQFGDGEDE